MGAGPWLAPCPRCGGDGEFFNRGTCRRCSGSDLDPDSDTPGLNRYAGSFYASEPLGVRPMDITHTEGGYRLRVDGKTGPREVAVSPSLVALLQSYAYESHLVRDARFFPINRHRVWQIVDSAAQLAVLAKPPGVGTVHILRHSGAIERMRASGNPRSVQDQLGHASTAMTLRYFRTLAAEEALRIQEGVDFGW